MDLLACLHQHLDPRGAAAQRMFSGTGFMINGNMLIATQRDGLLVRIDPADQASATALPGAALMEMRGRKMPGWITVSPQGCQTEAQVKAWIALALAFNQTLPPKAAKPAKKAAKKPKR